MPEKLSNSRGKKRTRKAARELGTKIAFLEGIVRRDPSYVEALQLLGDHYTEQGMFNNSLKVDQQLSQLQPANPLVFYNLACSYSLNGEVPLAAAALEKAISLGYRDFSWLSRDPDLRLLRQDPAYRNIKDKIKSIRILR